MKKPSNRGLSRIALALFLPVVFFLCGGLIFQCVIDNGAANLLKLEKEGRLSREYGYAWQQIRANKALQQSAATISNGKNFSGQATSTTGKKNRHFPSLAAVKELNKISHLDKTIRINDRNRVPLAILKTTHSSVTLAQLDTILLQSLLLTEDKNFYHRKKGYDCPALLRATIHAVFRTVSTRTLHYPRGGSTIHMQVARFLLLKTNTRGYTYTEKTIFRKINELQLAQALSMSYSKDEILTLYVNHCVSAGHGMTGYHDISTGLFGVPPDKLNIPQSLYLARLVKWNRQVPRKIITQIKASLPGLARHFKWSSHEQMRIIRELDSLSFCQPGPVIPENSYIIDYANESLRAICRMNGMSTTDLKEMDIANPESMLRRYGNADLTLTIDYRLQKWLERTVAARGFGPDTTIRTDIRIGTHKRTFIGKQVPPDTVRRSTICARDSVFTDPSTDASFTLKKGDTLLISVRYRRAGTDSIHRYCYIYKRDLLPVPGQYYAYAIMDSRTRHLLAYCSKDGLGSRLRSLLVNRNPNGSSVAKPLIYALAYDMDVYFPSDMATDNIEFPDTCRWARSYLYQGKNPVGMTYHHVPEKEGYAVRNHDRRFGGHDFLFNHLALSNNIMAVETMFRLTSDLTVPGSRSEYIKRYINRLGGDSNSVKRRITGPQLYGAMVSVVNDAYHDNAKSAENYSIALGTLELSLYEQLHLFNALYDNKVVVSPSQHPSLFIKSVLLSGEELPVTDRITTRTIFADYTKVAPVHCALHKRLVSNPGDNLARFDICDNHERLSNFAKSGTTDDVIRPFNADVNDTTRTNYGLWNAVLRIRLRRNDLRNAVARDTLISEQKNVVIPYDSIPSEEILDVTLACIGECNTHYTGDRDGKTLHGYVSRGLLHTFGVPCTSGYYRTYENELVKTVSDDVKYESEEKPDLPLLSRALISLQAGFGTKESVDKVSFEKSDSDEYIRLRGKNYRKMLSFASYMGKNARRYRDLLKKLKKNRSAKDVRTIINQISSLDVDNQVLKRDLDRACASLLQSLDSLGRISR